MQPSAGPVASQQPHPDPSHGPDLPHTRSRPVHWLATAVALAAVLGASALVQPSDATATPPSSSVGAKGGAAPAAPVPGPDPAKASYPMDCGSAEVGPEVLRKGSADFDGDGRAETVAVVRCAAGFGTPPSGVYVLARPAEEGGEPRIVETLVEPGEGMSVTAFAVRGGTISATLAGYSSADVPRCCPDQERRVEWRWKDGKFALTALPVAGSV